MRYFGAGTTHPLESVSGSPQFLVLVSSDGLPDYEACWCTDVAKSVAGHAQVLGEEMVGLSTTHAGRFSLFLFSVSESQWIFHRFEGCIELPLSLPCWWCVTVLNWDAGQAWGVGLQAFSVHHLTAQRWENENPSS